MPLTLVPLLGPFHLRHARYNAVTVRDVAAAARPTRLLTSALAAGSGRHELLDTDEIALPLAVAPWAAAEGLRLEPVGEPSPDPSAASDMERYLATVPAGQEALARLEEAREPVARLLGSPLDLPRVLDELVPAVAHLWEVRRELFGDGPGTDWAGSRADAVAARVRASGAQEGDHVAVLFAPVDQVPALAGRLETTVPRPVAPGDDARRRALLDAAMGGEARDPERMLQALRELPGAEARLAEADLLLSTGHGERALEILETASRGDFSRPYHVPGWLLARLGQLYDLAGRRDDALRAYRGVLALSWAPAAARDAASAGMQRPFDPTATGE